MKKQKLVHVKPSYIDGGVVWHDIGKFPLEGYTIIVEKEEKASDGLFWVHENVCMERADRFEPTMSFVPKRWAYAIDLAQCKTTDGRVVGDDCFERAQHDIAESYAKIEEEASDRGYSEATIKKLEMVKHILKKAEVYAHRVGRLLDGVDGEDKFRSLLVQDLIELRKKGKSCLGEK